MAEKTASMSQKDFGIWFWVHTVFIIMAYTSPLYVDWRLIIVGVILIQAQDLIFGGCIITYLEMGNGTKDSFIRYYLSKIYPGINPIAIRFLATIFIPAFLVVSSLILQFKFGMRPVLKI